MRLKTPLHFVIASQFLGAVNDNLVKVMVSLVAIDAALKAEGSIGNVVMTGMSFVVPFLLFSPVAGSLADKFPKARVMQGAKIMELLVIILGGIFFLQKSAIGLNVAIFLMGAHSAIFSPSKYGSLAEFVDHKDLAKANGYLELFTMIGSILGTGLGGPIKLLAGSYPLIAAGFLISIALTGLTFALRIPVVAAANPRSKLNVNPFQVIPIFAEIVKYKKLFAALAIAGYFWGVAALYQLNISLYSREIVGADDIWTSVFLAALATGIGVGAVLAGKISEGGIEMGLVPIGAFGVGMTSILLGPFSGSYLIVALLLFMMGIGGGFFVVPLNAYFQHNSPAERRGSYIAASNTAAYFAMIVAYSIMYAEQGLLGMSAMATFYINGVFALGLMGYLFWQDRIVVLRCLNWIICHTFYDLRVLGLNNIPKEGGALLVCNHTSYVDPPLLIASSSRFIRFLMYQPLYDWWAMKPIVSTMQAIPINTDRGIKSMMVALMKARAAVEAGEIVCIFAEGELTRIGRMVSFRKGFERVMKGVNAPIVPVYIDQLWGSIFSKRGGKFFWKIPRQLPYPVTISFGAPMLASSSAFEVRQKVQEIAAEVATSHRERSPSLRAAFARIAQRRIFTEAITDSTGRRMTYLKTFVGGCLLADKLRPQLPGSRVGVLLPPSVAGALTNIAISFMGKVAVNFNYTVGKEGMAAALKKAKPDRTITSRQFLHRLKIDPAPFDPIYIEDCLKDLPKFKAIYYSLILIFCPTKLTLFLLWRETNRRKELATIIFSSGSTAEPKGIMLTEGNILSNVGALNELFQLTRKDAMLGVLPFFHSFGYTGTLWFPLLAGIKTSYHFNPLDATTVGELTQAEESTILVATPTFLQSYTRKCAPENFRSLRHIVVGAEKLKERISGAFKEKFGILPLEGYGCTELSPVALINIPDYQGDSVNQIGNKPGTAGHPIPAVAAKIVDPDTFIDLGMDKEGLLLIKGPNVMKGYLDDEAQTKEVIRDGWYVTGDIAKIDEDGFVTITDRLSRFSKIGGEMVPHIKIEEEIHTALGEVENMCAVTGVADDRKGEQLVVLHTKDIDVDKVLKQLSDQGLHNMWIPKANRFFKIDALPLLGSGKLDLKLLNRVAQEKVSGAGS